MEALQANVVVSAFEHGVGQWSRQEVRQGRRNDGEIAFDELTLQGQGGRRHDDGAVRGRMQGRGHEIGEGLARARAGLHQQVFGSLATRGQCRGDRLRHRELSIAWLAIQRRRGCHESRGDIPLGHGAGTPRRDAKSGRTRARNRVPSGRCSTESTSPSAWAAATRSPRS